MRKNDLTETLKNGFAWTVIFFVGFLYVCKWSTGS